MRIGTAGDKGMWTISTHSGNTFVSNRTLWDHVQGVGKHWPVAASLGQFIPRTSLRAAPAHSSHTYHELSLCFQDSWNLRDASLLRSPVLLSRVQLLRGAAVGLPTLLKMFPPSWLRLWYLFSN